MASNNGPNFEKKKATQNSLEVYLNSNRDPVSFVNDHAKPYYSYFHNYSLWQINMKQDYGFKACFYSEFSNLKLHPQSEIYPEPI